MVSQIRPLQNDQVSEDARLELDPHFRLHRRRANQPLHAQPRRGELRHVDVERRSNLEVELEVVVRSVVNIDRLFSPLVVNLPTGTIQGTAYKGYIKRYKVHNANVEPTRTKQATARRTNREGGELLMNWSAVTLMAARKLAKEVIKGLKATAKHSDALCSFCSCRGSYL